MADPTVSLIQQTGRTVHTSPSGIEIIRNFYIEPYEAHTTVTKALQGSVTGGEGAWVRTAPARDPWIPACFCTEAVADPVDPDAWASSGSISEQGPVIGEPQLNTLVDILERKKAPQSGANITAHYRPMITAWENPFEPEYALDWLDPKIEPGVRQLPWPGGMNVKSVPGYTFNVPAAVAAPIEVPISSVSIRRILVGSVPHGKIKAASGAINDGIFPAPGTGAAGGLPKFEKGTLKFEGADVQNMVGSDGSRWYEITYRFKWIHLPDATLISALGTETKGWVTWNHILFCPSFFGLQGKVGWYEVFRGKQRNLAFDGVINIQLPLMAVFGGRLYNETNFAPLFTLN